MPFKLIKWTISLTIIFLVGHYILIPSTIYFKNEGFERIINKLIKKDIQKFVPEEIYVKLPQQLKNIKVSKRWEEIFKLANLIKENKTDVTKIGIGMYSIGRATFNEIWSTKNPLDKDFFDFTNGLNEYPDITVPFDPKLVNSIIKELKNIDYKT